MTISPGSSGNRDLPDSLRTIAKPAEAELKVKRSRFVALAFPVDEEPAARERLAETARRHHDARHLCFAYRLGCGVSALTRRSDAGEPAGTAGEPILAAIVKLDLTNVLVVVVRYFGGIRLGTGGLARAYGQAGALVLEKAGTRVVPLGREFLLEFSYAQEKSVRHLLAAHEGRRLDAEYGTRVTWRIWLRHSAWRGFADALTESTAGTVHLTDFGN